MEFEYPITVFTATYNRAHTLERLYRSLVNQTFRNFEWLIIDDGSTDNSEDLIKTFINENKIIIRYYKQLNRGKHFAINIGLDLADGEWFFMVDSDDYLTDDSLHLIHRYINKSNGDYEGLVFRKGYDNFKKIGTPFPKDEFLSNHIHKTYKLKLKGDLAEVFKTSILSKCKFNEEIKEKFCAESLMWNRTVKIGTTSLFVDRIIYVAEYLEDGLSAKSVQNRRNSSNFTTLLYKELAEFKQLNFIQKARTYVNYWRFSCFNGKTFIENIIAIKYNWIGLITIPLGLLMKIRDDKNIM